MYWKLRRCLSLVLFLAVCGIATLPLQSAASRANLPVLPEGALTVSKCVEIAIARNFSVVSASENVNESIGAQIAAIGGLAPSVTAGAGFGRRIQGPTESYYPEYDITVLSSGSTSDSYYYTFQATQNLISVPDWARFSSASHSVRASRHSLDAAKQSAVYQVKLQFYELLKSMKLAEVSKTAMQLSRDELDRAKALYEVGSVAKSDVLKAEVRVSQSELSLIAADNKVKLERSRLAKLLGLPVDSPINIDENLGEETPQVQVEDSVRKALERRPDLLAVRENLKGAKASVLASKAGRLPTAYTSFSYNWSDNEFPRTEAARDKNYYWSVRLGISVPLFDGLATTASVRQARARAAIADNNVRDSELQTALDVKEAMLGLDQATQTIKASKTGLASAEEDYRLSRERYDVGSGTMLELLNAEVSLSQARSSYVEAVASLREAEALFEKATGQPVK
ncbi:MAG: TolC family protein [Candidatus Eisenbacteria bacterium]|nr:TolC family protein [Candidatus Eisenbacteria bacterium]